MSDDQRSAADEMEDDLRTGGDLAGRALKGLPSREHRGGKPPAAPDTPPKAPGEQRGPEGSSSNGSDGSDGGGDSGTKSSEPGSDGPERPPAAREAPGQSQKPGSPDGGWNGAGGDSEASPPNGAGAGGDFSAGAPAEGGSGAGSVSGAGAAAGTEAGAAGAEAGAAAGSGAAGGAAAGGAAAGATSGAATGAVAGSAAGPAGAAAGAAAGVLLVPLIKLIVAGVAVIAVFLMFFMMLPSFLFDNSNALNDRELLEDSYNSYYSHISQEYKADIERAMGKAESEGRKIFKEAESDGASGIFAAPEEYPHIAMQADDQEAIRSIINSSRYDDYEFEYSVVFLKDIDSYVEAASSNINLVLSLIDTQKRNWFVNLFEAFMDEISGGLYGQFTDWIGRKWDGIWNEFIVHDLYSISYGGVTTRTVAYQLPNGEEHVEIIAEIEIVYTYDLKDQGISFYANKLNADQDQIDRAAEMANYLGDLFGSASDSYFGMFVEGGYFTDAIQSGTVGANIANALQQLEDVIDGMEYDPDGPHAFPLQGYTTPNMSSHYGPRDFASDPWHTGIDFAAPTGTPILAAADGVVLFIAQMPNGFGNYIVVYHGDYNGTPVCTMYAHMSAFGNYRQGDPVSAGDVIGYVGSTGLSTGPHLHFQLHVGDTVRNPVEFFEFLSYLRP